MMDALENVRTVFEKAMGPFQRRHKIMEELKEPDVGKEKRARLVKEAAEIDEQWKGDLKELKQALNAYGEL